MLVVAWVDRAQDGRRDQSMGDSLGIQQLREVVTTDRGHRGDHQCCRGRRAEIISPTAMSKLGEAVCRNLASDVIR